MDQSTFEKIVSRAAQAPSVHNAQPTRWRLQGGQIWIAQDPSVTLPHADPDGHSMALSCGAAIEATIIALSNAGFTAKVVDVWENDDRHSWPRHRMAAVVTVSKGIKTDSLAKHLEDRFTWRGAFGAAAPALFGWNRPDTILIMDAPRRQWLAALNDRASLKILRDGAFRKELLSWMRLRPQHPRVQFDGMNQQALGLTRGMARRLALGFGPLWRVLDLMRQSGPMTAQYDVTLTAPLIACFHRPINESPVVTGRAYMRFWLEATSLGLAGWPMAALSDDPNARKEIEAQLAIPPNQRLVQVMRLGKMGGTRPPRARRPLTELIP